MNLGASYVEIRARYDKLNQDLAKSKGSVDAACRDMQRVIASVNWGVISAGATIATAAAVSGFKRAVDAASALTETQNKVNQIFGAGAKTINDWASKSVNAFGLSRQAALDAAGTMGNMWKQLGATTGEAAKNSMAMVQLSADIASFHNVSGGAVKVLEDMQSAFRGEYDPIQKYIPMINAASVEQEALANTGKKASKELTFLEKAVAAQELIMRGAGAAVGDFNRTADEYANKTRIMHARVEDLTAKIGISLIPVAEDIVNKVDAWVDANDDLLAQRVAGWVDETYTSVKSMVDLYGSLPAEVVAGAGAGVVGRIIFGGWTPAYLIGSVAAMNEGLKNFDLNLGNLYKFDQSDVEPFQNLWAVITGKKDWNTGAALNQPITMPAVAPAVAPAPVETASSAVSTATKKAASEQLKIRKEFSDKYQELVLDDYDYAVLTLNREVEKYKAAGADKTQLAEYYTRKLGDLQNEHLTVVEGSNNEQYESELTKWKRIDRASMAGVDAAIERHEQLTDEAESSAAEQADAYRKLYDDLGQVSRESYLFKVGLLDQEYNQLKKILGDSALLQAAYARRKKELDWEMRLSTDDFLDGMLVAWEKHEDEKLTLAEHGAQLWKGIQESMASGFHDLFYDALTGDLKSLSDYADAVWRGIANSFATMAADMVAEYAMTGLKDLLTGEGGDSLIGGIIGAASGIWDAVDWLGSDMLSLWHTGAYMISEDQIAKLKAGEMVIPAEQAAELRALIEGSGGGIPWGDAPWMAGGEGGIGGIGGGTAGGAAGISAGNAIGMAAAQGAALGVAATMGLGVSQGIDIGSTLGVAAQSGVMGGLVGAIGGVPEALGAESAAADIGTALGTAIGSALGVPGLGAAALGALGAIGLDAVADALGLAIGTPGTSVMGMIGSALGIGDQGMTGYGGFGGLGIGNPGSYGGSSMGGYGGFGGLGIGNPGSYGGDNGGGIGGGLGSGEGMGGLGSGEGMGGGTGIGGVSGDPAGDSADNGGGWARGGWAVGPTSGYAATLHGTEYVLNQDQVKAVRDLVGGGRGAVVQIYFDSPELERFVKVKSQDAQIKRERRAQRGRRDTTGSTPARIF